MNYNMIATKPTSNQNHAVKNTHTKPHYKSMFIKIAKIMDI